MAKNTPNKKTKIVTPFRISVAINIILALVIVGIAGTAAYLYKQYYSGSLTSARWALSRSLDYCEMSAEHLDSWIASDETGYYRTPDSIKRAKINDDVVCTRGDFAPYLEKATKDYYKSKNMPFEDPAVE